MEIKSAPTCPIVEQTPDSSDAQPICQYQPVEEESATASEQPTNNSSWRGKDPLEGLQVLAEGALRAACPDVQETHDQTQPDKVRSSKKRKHCDSGDTGEMTVPSRFGTSSKIGRVEHVCCARIHANVSISSSREDSLCDETTMSATTATTTTTEHENEKLTRVEDCLLQNLRSEMETRRRLVELLHGQAETNLLSTIIGIGSAGTLDSLLYHNMVPPAGVLGNTLGSNLGYHHPRSASSSNIGGVLPLSSGLVASSNTHYSRLALQCLAGGLQPPLLETLRQPPLQTLPFAPALSTVLSQHCPRAVPPRPTQRIVIAPEPATTKAAGYQEAESSVSPKEADAGSSFALPSRWVLNSLSQHDVCTSSGGTSNDSSNVQVLGKLYALPLKWYEKESIVSLLDQKKAFLVPKNSNSESSSPKCENRSSSALFWLYVPKN